MISRRGVDPQDALVLVTGAGGGIGRATALAFAAEGARLVCVDIDGEAAEKTAADCGGAAYRVDVADRAAMIGLAATVERAQGVPHVLVNNAGVGLSGRFLDTTLDDWNWILGINLTGVIHGCHAFGPGMTARGRGQVVNVSSGLGYTPRATEPAYVTSKAGVLALSRCLRADWHDAGVGVSVVCPGVIDTDIVRHTRYRGERADPEAVDRVQRIFRRGHRPEKVARAIVGAARHNRGVVPVGIEARLGWLLHGVLPSRLADRVARARVLGV